MYAYERYLRGMGGTGMILGISKAGPKATSWLLPRPGPRPPPRALFRVRELLVEHSRCHAPNMLHIDMPETAPCPLHPAPHIPFKAPAERLAGEAPQYSYSCDSITTRIHGGAILSGRDHCPSSPDCPPFQTSARAPRIPPDSGQAPPLATRRPLAPSGATSALESPRPLVPTLDFSDTYGTACPTPRRGQRRRSPRS